MEKRVSDLPVSAPASEEEKMPTHAAKMVREPEIAADDLREGSEEPETVFRVQPSQTAPVMLPVEPRNRPTATLLYLWLGAISMVTITFFGVAVSQRNFTGIAVMALVLTTAIIAFRVSRHDRKRDHHAE